MNKMYWNEGVDKLISAVISNAISTYLAYQNEIKKLKQKVATFKYEGKIKYRYNTLTNTTIIYYTSSARKRENDVMKITQLQGECDYIMRWFGSKAFEDLTQGDYNGQYFIEVLESCDENTREKIRTTNKKLKPQEIDIEESLKL